MMNILRIRTWLLSVVVLAACGDNLGAPADDGDATASDPDARLDARDPDARDPDASGPDASAMLSVVSTSPANAATAVATASRIRATFSHAMNPATLTTASFRVRTGANDILGTVSYDPATLTATFHPTALLADSAAYTATITTAAMDQGGRTLAANHVWTFTTGSCGAQTPVVLGAVGAYAVLAGSTVTNTGATSVTGDLGVSPGTEVTGFPPGILVGTQQAGTAAAGVAMGALTTAYNEAAGRTLCPVSVAGNLGGMTLAPGLYKSTSGLEITSGDLTLDGQGNVDAVFVFQMASTLMTTAGRQVILIGGARATNVFWQVGTAASLGTTTAFQGTIMADQMISLDTGATLNGRALARIAGVTLAGNTIVRPVD